MLKIPRLLLAAKIELQRPDLPSARKPGKTEETTVFRLWTTGEAGL